MIFSSRPPIWRTSRRFLSPTQGGGPTGPCCWPRCCCGRSPFPFACCGFSCASSCGRSNSWGSGEIEKRKKEKRKTKQVRASCTCTEEKGREAGEGSCLKALAESPPRDFVLCSEGGEGGSHCRAFRFSRV